MRRHLEATEALADWSPYGVGDLVDAARRAAELIGSSTEVLAIAVGAPPNTSALPTARLVVDDAELSERIRERLTDQEMLPFFVGTPFASTWAAEADDFVLQVACVEEEL